MASCCSTLTLSYHRTVAMSWFPIKAYWKQAPMHIVLYHTKKIPRHPYYETAVLTGIKIHYALNYENEEGKERRKRVSKARGGGKKSERRKWGKGKR